MDDEDDYVIETLIPEEEVAARIKEIAAEISKDYSGKQLKLICVLKGGAYFM